jgi:uncharacterized protein (TIGR02996 family)
MEMDADSIKDLTAEPDVIAFLKAIQAGNFDAAGIFADWLEEHNDPRGKLLRRRWKRWQKERQQIDQNAFAQEQMTTAPWEKMLADLKAAGATIAGSTVKATVSRDYRKPDDSFRLYIREKFPQESYEASDPTNSQAYMDS